MNYWQLDASMRSGITILIIALVVLISYILIKIYNCICEKAAKQREAYKYIVRVYTKENKRLEDELEWLREEYKRLERGK